jgi:serine phosphatase RsbU (regulator of sigma subunit)
VVQAVFDAMRAFRGDASQTDDQTVVVVRLTGA